VNKLTDSELMANTENSKIKPTDTNLYYFKIDSITHFNSF